MLVRCFENLNDRTQVTPAQTSLGLIYQESDNIVFVDSVHFKIPLTSHKLVSLGKSVPSSTIQVNLTVADFPSYSRTESITYLSPNTDGDGPLASSDVATSSARSRNHSAS